MSVALLYAAYSRLPKRPDTAQTFNQKLTTPSCECNAEIKSPMLVRGGSNMACALKTAA